MKWCSQSEGGVAGDEEGPSSHDVKRHAQLVAQLLHIEWTDAKSKLVQEMNEREAKNYDNLLGVRHTIREIAITQDRVLVSNREWGKIPLTFFYMGWFSQSNNT